jgi:CheY-like chemotaxis protein
MSSLPAPSPFSGLRVLIVDDNFDSASTLALFLEISGHQVRVAHDGREAIVAADEFRPDVVLMDIGLPGLNGHEAGRAIRSQPWAAQLVLIAISGWGQDVDKQRSREAGFHHHLVKPVDHGMLVQLLSQASAMRDIRRGEGPAGPPRE